MFTSLKIIGGVTDPPIGIAPVTRQLEARKRGNHRNWLCEITAGTAELAALLKKFRVKAGLSQQTLADRALISVQAISALERGYRKAPYRATLERIADALALSEEARQTLEHSARRSRGPRLSSQIDRRTICRDSLHRSSDATKSLERSPI